MAVAVRYPPVVVDAFYVQDGDRFVASEWTRGPWDPGAQHAGPAAALVARCIEHLDPPGFQVARFTLEVLRPIPIGPLRVEARAVRTGRQVQFAEAVLLDDGGDVARASSWRIRPPDDQVSPANLEPPAFPPPGACAPAQPLDPGAGPGYLSAMEWRPAAGAFFDSPGPAAAWVRMRVPLVLGEEPSPLSRVLVVADSGNGVSAELPFGTHLFINTELSVHLVRMPEGPWVCLDAITRIESRGIGLAESVLWDERGQLGRGAQTLLVARRRESARRR
jgi:hypothetical protein